ncbi:MAG: asparagine synthase (glutamine-hydrolyzing) [Opitutales bacterium]|nr:MAG: asparagine synthase (glutamine-hydrolyzing) [Opitutales bacterium]
MCGIFGAIGPDAESLAKKATVSLAHRGPDGSGSFFAAEARLGLAQTRLAIQDLGVTATQPMTDPAGLATIIFNGEIYNFHELRNQLASGYEFRSSGDTEVILAAYLRWGDDMLGKLNGIFAFAIYDHRQRSVLLARDGLGVKPLYCLQTKSHFAFASEIKALLQVPDFDRSLDLQGISQYLTYLYSPGEHTPFKYVQKFPPGHAVRLLDGVKIREWCFYELPYEQEPLPFTVKGAADELKNRLDTAIERQMISDAPLGAFLSGGLDSSAICALAQRQLGSRRLDCFTIDVRLPVNSQEGFVDDLPYARLAAKALGLNLHVAEVSQDKLLDLEKLVWHLDEPQADPAALNNFYICQFARQQGIKVLLSGAGGDDIFTGYRRHQALDFERYWQWMPAPVKESLAYLSGHAPPATSWGRRIQKAFRQATLSPQERMVGYFQWIDQGRLKSLWSKEIKAAGNLPDSNAPLIKALQSLPAGTLELNQMLYLEAKYFLTDHNLNYTDKMSMAAGVEVRVPFLDRDLIDFATRLPVDYKQHGRVGKWIFRKSMEGILPQEIIYRPKTGFGIPLRGWMMVKDNRIEADYLSRQSIINRGLFDPDEVHKLIADNRSGYVDASYVILALACVEIWCRQYHDV